MLVTNYNGNLSEDTYKRPGGSLCHSIVEHAKLLEFDSRNDFLAQSIEVKRKNFIRYNGFFDQVFSHLDVLNLSRQDIFDFFEEQFSSKSTKKKGTKKTLMIKENDYGTKTISLIIKSNKKTYFFEKNLISNKIKKITMLSIL